MGTYMHRKGFIKERIFMRVLDNNNEEVKDPDLNVGHIIKDQFLLRHYDAVPETSGKFHYETVQEYPNGEKDQVQVWDEKPIAAQREYDEYEYIWRYILYAPDELEAIKKKKVDTTNAPTPATNELATTDLASYAASLEERIKVLEEAKK